MKRREFIRLGWSVIAPFLILIGVTTVSASAQGNPQATPRIK
jgi:hypothetical protein